MKRSKPKVVKATKPRIKTNKSLQNLISSQKTINNFGIIDNKFGEASTKVSLYHALNASYSKNKDNKESIDHLTSKGYLQDTGISSNNHTLFVNKEKKKALFTVKGTDPSNINDLATDVVLGFAGTRFGLNKTPRFGESKNSLATAKQQYDGYDFTILGHSLGASIASQIADKNDKVYTMNKGVGLPNFVFGGEDAQKETEIKTRYDPVSALSRADITIPFATSLNPLRAHRLDNLNKNWEIADS